METWYTNSEDMYSLTALKKKLYNFIKKNTALYFFLNIKSSKFWSAFSTLCVFCSININILNGNYMNESCLT